MESKKSWTMERGGIWNFRNNWNQGLEIFPGLSHCFSPLLFSACWLHSFSLQTSWFHMAGHLGADSSCFTFYGFHTGKGFFFLSFSSKILDKDSDGYILAQDQWSRVLGHLTILCNSEKYLQKHEKEWFLKQYQLCTFKTHT